MYKYIKNITTQQNSIIVIQRLSDNAFIPFDPDNTDYQAFLRWCEEGGQPLPAEENQ
jgi:hypothetical protein